MRNRFFFGLDIVLAAAVVVLSFSARFEGIDWGPEWGRAMLLFIIAAVPIKIALFYSAGIYRRLWRYASITDLEVLLVAFLLGAAASFGIGIVILPALGLIPGRLPLSILLSDSLLTGAAISLPRLLLRVVARRARSRKVSDRRRRSVTPRRQRGC